MPSATSTRVHQNKKHAKLNYMNPVKSAIFAVLSVCLIVLAPVLLVTQAGSNQAEASTAGDTCQVVAGVKEGNTLIITACGQTFSVDVNRLANNTLGLGSITLPPGGVITETVTLPPVVETVTLPPLPRATVTLPPIRIPGPTEIIRLPRATATVTVPGPTEFIRPPSDPRPTVNVQPTETVTVRPNNAEPSERPTATVTVTEEPTGQPSPTSGTVEPSPESEVVTRTETRTKTETIVRNVLLGTLASLVLAGLGILAMFLGYILGQKDAKKNEDNFLESLRDSVRLSKNT